MWTHFFLLHLINPPIGQTLSFNAGDRNLCALSVRGLAMIPAKIKFIAVSLKMMLAAMVECAIQSALNQGEAAFNRVGAFAVGADIFISGVSHDVVTAIKFLADPAIGA